jgi:hypothetical protein
MPIRPMLDQGGTTVQGGPAPAQRADADSPLAGQLPDWDLVPADPLLVRRRVRSAAGTAALNVLSAMPPAAAPAGAAPPSAPRSAPPTPVPSAAPPAAPAFCTSCGGALDEGALFCTQCGTRRA